MSEQHDGNEPTTEHPQGSEDFVDVTAPLDRPPTRDTIRDIAHGLEEAASWLRAHQGLALFDMDDKGNCYKNGSVRVGILEFERKVTIYLTPNTKQGLKEIARALGTFEKSHDAFNYTITQGIASDAQWSVCVKASVARNLVCERRQVGTKMEKRHSPEAPLIEVEVPVFEYDCTDALLNGGD